MCGLISFSLLELGLKEFIRFTFKSNNLDLNKQFSDWQQNYSFHINQEVIWTVQDYNVFSTSILKQNKLPLPVKRQNVKMDPTERIKTKPIMPSFIIKTKVFYECHHPF